MEESFKIKMERARRQADDFKKQCDELLVKYKDAISLIKINLIEMNSLMGALDKEKSIALFEKAALTKIHMDPLAEQQDIIRELAAQSDDFLDTLKTVQDILAVYEEPMKKAFKNIHKQFWGSS